MAERRRPVRPSGPRVLGAVLAGLVVCLGALRTLTVGDPSPAAAQPGVTTTTLPIENPDDEQNREFGEIIPKPDSGREPEHPGDRGGWQQITLFFLLIAAIALIALVVWWRSRVARQRRAALGLDPESLARARGDG